MGVDVAPGQQFVKPIIWNANYNGKCHSLFPEDEIDACYSAAPALPDTSALPGGKKPSKAAFIDGPNWFRFDCAATTTQSYQTSHTAELTMHPDGSHELKLSAPLQHGGGLLPIQPGESSMTLSGHRLLNNRCPFGCPCGGRGPCRHRGRYFGYQ
jgi:hypothetical protein